MDERDPDLLPVPEREFLTREQAEEDDTVDVDEYDIRPYDWARWAASREP